MLDLDDAVDFPGNEGSVFGRPLSSYPLMAARTSAHVRRIYVLTGSPAVKSAALQYDAVIIDPPKIKPSLPGFLQHGYNAIKKELQREDTGLELLAVLLANAPAVTKDMIDTGIEALLDRPELDSALSVAPLERWSPLLTKRQSEDGLLTPFYPAPAGNAIPKAGQGGALPGIEFAAWYPTWGVTVLRPKHLETPSGDPPLPCLGRNILPLKQWGGGPIDYQWQVPCLEYWLKKNGIVDASAHLERKPKPQLAPKTDRR
jgi:hypothetical protein